LGSFLGGLELAPESHSLTECGVINAGCLKSPTIR